MPWGLWLPSALIALGMAVPLVYLLYQASSVAPDVWARLLQTRVPGLVVNTLLLTGLVTIGALGLGLLLAWLVERTDLPARKTLRSLFIAPLIVPCYLVAICYAAFFGVNGLLEKMLQSVGWEMSVPSIYGLGGAAFVLILATYPYVYLVARASLEHFDPTLLDAARACGASRVRTALRVTLPLLVPALSAGGVLAALYSLSDFGVVTALRHPTFVSVIYQQLTGRYDPSAAAALGVLLVLLTLLLLWGQGRIWRRRRFASEKPSGRPTPLVRLALWKIPAMVLIAAALIAGLLLPLGILSYWLMDSWLIPQTNALLWGTSGNALLNQLLNSFTVSVAAASLAVLLALPLAYASVRYRDRWRWAWVSQAGQSLPGVLIALGLLFVVLRFLPGLYATVLLVILAYVVRFFSQALQALGSGLAQIPARLEEGARLLGHRPISAFARVTLPLLRPALAGAWILVFLSALRELPATLLLRPAGFDTLPVRIWTAASEGFYAQAAPAALVLIGLSIPLLFWLHRGSSTSVKPYD